MGIQGLLPFLKAIHQPVNIADFQGCTVAIDAYCWLHKGAFSCAEKLALGEKTDQYVYYCMKYINYMLRKNLKPILVFDGCHLKSKADVEKSRRERRELHRKKAAQFLREGKRSEAKECLQRCVDITPQMALELMNACRDKGVDCIVAPYEADAQLAYLSLQGIAQIIVTEDSDLLLFGCEKIIFKMDFFGNGTLIEKARLNEVLSIQGGFYTFEKFRHMCILSGCDYLSSLPGIGLIKACKVFKTARQPDMRQLLKKLPTYLKMNLTVTDEYIDGFIRADNTFLYQLVYDPLKRSLCPLNPYPPEIDPDKLDYAGQYIPEEKAYQIALGNVDIHDHKCIAYFDPDTFVPKNAPKPKFRHQLSIWDKNYHIKSGSPCKDIQLPQEEKQKDGLRGKEQTVKILLAKRKSPSKRQREDPSPPDTKTDEELMSLYGEDDENEYPQAKRVKRNLMESLSHSEPASFEKIDDDFALSSLITSTPQRKLRKQDKGQEDDSDDEHENVEDVKIPKGGRKRRVSGTPSRISAADIGEEAFKACSKDSKENLTGSLTPDKNRNMFAVPAGAVKAPRFNVNAPAVQVKSRYFSSGSASVQPHTNPTSSPSKQKTSPSPRKSLTQPVSKKTASAQQHSIRTMFENAPLQSKQSRDMGLEVKVEKPRVKKGMHRYLLPAGAVSQSAENLFRSLKPKSSENGTDGDNVTEKQTSRFSQTPQGLSVFGKFQSMFSKSDSGQKPPRPSLTSAFSWSKTKFAQANDINRSAAAFEQDGKQTSSTLEEKLIKEVDGSQSKPVGNCGKQDYEIEHTEINNHSMPCLESEVGGTNQSEISNCELTSVDRIDKNAHPSLSSYFKTSLPLTSSEKTSSSESVKMGVDKAQGSSSSVAEIKITSAEVKELKSYDYGEFLKTLSAGSDLAESMTGSGDAKSNSPSSETVSLSQSLDDSVGMGESASQVLNTSGQRDGDGTQDASLRSLDRGKECTFRDSQRSLLGSIDSFCLPSSEDIIDLTDGESDSQISCASSLSKSSSLSGQSQSTCRVSGLSRNKNMSSRLKKANSTPTLQGQRSIKDLMSKFQYTRNAPVLSKPTSSTTVVNEDEDTNMNDDDMRHATPVTSKMEVNAEKVQRKLCI